MFDEPPDFRATVADGVVRLVDWGPWLASGGPLQTLLHARGRAGVTIADLTVVREGEVATELVVAFVTGDGPAARETLAGWAASVGYRRLWFPGAVVELDPRAGGPATTRCSGCAVRLEDDEAGFWLHVRRSGRFPLLCPLCGCDLPQWRTRDGDRGDLRVSDRAEDARPVPRGETR